MKFVPFLFAAAAALPFAGCTSLPSSGTSEDIDFVTKIKPIFQDRCVMCHNRETLPKRTSFESGKLALAGDKQGPIIIPGNPSSSRLILALSAPDIHDQAMPPVSIRVSKKELALLTEWIEAGADWPAGTEGAIIPTERPLE